MKTQPAISLPQGVRDILPEEAKSIVRIEAQILSVFERYGFKMVLTPLLEYVDVLSLGMGENLKDKVLKFIDPSTGKVIAIRPDITPQIARVAATRMRDYPLPLKLCYNESVIRCHESRDGKSSEVRQAGAEYISSASSPEADAEMITMAIVALKETGLRAFKVDIGDVGFLRAVINGLGLETADQKRVKDAIAIKDSSSLEAILEGFSKKVNKDDKKLLLNLTAFYGEDEVIKKAAAVTKNKTALGSLENLRQVIDIIGKNGFKDCITVDLGEVRGFDYYTGVIFEGFAAGVGKAILGGGRYDNLMERYGSPLAATGFAFNVENIIAALGRNPAP
ncbi:MAG: ATP phosphoribosyltransferase regulatory subunit [Deltaproteobacteria bacterium]|nr:ATP phosphoribosyltransferase regulatory subunit [Deltaproteobacteria bacterium]